MKRNWSLIADRLERDGGLMPTAAAARLVPAHRGKSPHATTQTLNRWITHGKDGVHLDGLKVGRGWVTTKAAILRFLTACSEMESEQPTTPAGLDERQRRAEAAKARIFG